MQYHSPSTLLFIFIFLLLHFRYVFSQLHSRANWCSDTGNYTTNGSFDKNLKQLLTTLSKNTPPTGFFNATSGKDPDQVYGLALCQGDLGPAECQTCINKAMQDIITLCPNGKAAMIWFDECFLRYSNTSFFSSSSSTLYYINNQKNTSDPIRFGEARNMLLDKLVQQAAYESSSPLLFARGDTNFTSSGKLYALVQCTRDLTPDLCWQCLKDEQRYIPDRSAVRIGARYMGGSCFMRYETYIFFKPISAAAPPVAAPPPVTTTNHTTMAGAGEVFSEKNNKNKIIIIITVIVVVAVMVMCSAVTSIFLCRRKNTKKTILDPEVQFESTEFPSFDLMELRQATNNFSNANKLGEGGFGQVYKGVLENEQEIAVKRLARGSMQGLVELRNEVILVAKLQHKNLVRLLGCCLQENEMLLVYEYLPNTSLDKFLYDPIKCEQLDWATRLKIIEGIGWGLQYLHEDSRLKVIHRDLKVSNILLDGNMNPKIADFGLAKLFHGEQTQGATSRIAGTYGYMAPEYAMHGQFSTRSDVFSFGVIILEIVTGRRNFGFEASGEVADLLNYVWQHWSTGTMSEALDRRLIGKCSMQEVQRCTHIALLCIQEDPSQRPNMSFVNLSLNSCSVTLPPPGAIAWKNTTFMSSIVTKEEERDWPDEEGSNRSSKSSASGFLPQ